MALERNLTDVEVRVLGCLVEKESTTPEQYPLTLNSLRLACNQKTNRHPVTDYEEGEVGHAVRALEALKLVKAAWGARAAKYEHTAKAGLGLNTRELAVLYPMLVRGPVTPAEIRARCQKLAEFDDVDDVEYLLERLSQRDPALVTRLDRQPGQKEARYAHLLAGEPDVEAMPSGSSARASSLAARVEALEDTVERLERRLAALEPESQAVAE